MLKSLVTLMITTLLFFPDATVYDRPEHYGYQTRDVWLEPEAGQRVHGVYIQAPEEKGALLYLHGNAGNLTGRYYKVQGWVKHGISVLLLDYRSYGKSGGKIHRGEDIVEDARAAYTWLTQDQGILAEKVILYGESLGSHPAIRLAEEHTAAALVLEAPYTSFAELAPLHYPIIPPFMARTLLRDFSFSNTDHIEKIRCPLFILHGTEDPTCPYEMGRRLYEAAKVPKDMLTVPGGEHNNLPESAGEDYWQKPWEFVRGHAF